jgi:glycogen debranching enzyme
MAAALAPLIIAGFFELAKAALQMYLQYMKIAGKTPEEIETVYQEAKAQFLANDPHDLPDV